MRCLLSFVALLVVAQLCSAFTIVRPATVSRPATNLAMFSKDDGPTPAVSALEEVKPEDEQGLEPAAVSTEVDTKSVVRDMNTGEIREVRRMCLRGDIVVDR